MWEPNQKILSKAETFWLNDHRKDTSSLNRAELNREIQIKELNLDKEEMYYYLLKPYECERINDFDDFQQKNNYTYICRYNQWGKNFKKAWNALDHMRMHEGVRPYKCQFCSKSFTQKCNFKKHEKRHQGKTLDSRKKFKCRECKKGFTELYNLKVKQLKC